MGTYMRVCIEMCACGVGRLTPYVEVLWTHSNTTSCILCMFARIMARV